MGTDGSAYDYIFVSNDFSCKRIWTDRKLCYRRYSFGYWGNLLVVVFSCVSTTGWNAINAISGASCLVAVSNGTMPAWAGVVILATIVWFICVVGISGIHKIDTYLWLPSLLVWYVETQKRLASQS